ncbi:MAG: hypothetical protein A2139_06850 [Desulfobacca sp. RBG_16_60_12]|nr:MAG: hypothetical protein A2139_06850 [Desulfobacca sp. RBG_16_60_12]
MDLDRFHAAHEAFLRHMEANAPKGELFVSFDHPFIQSDEVEYKRLVVARGHNALQLSEWGTWAKQTGLILESVRRACSPAVSANLLEHRFGTSGSYKALYRVKTDQEIGLLETRLYDFFLGGTMSRAAFAPRFDQFAGYLRDARLGSNWAFVAYLAFLADHRRYFPILPSQFDKLLDYYGLGGRLSGRVEWQRYALLLELAEDLKAELGEYGPVEMIGVQSYMWVVSGLLRDGKVEDAPTYEVVDYQGELGRRQRSAAENERIGLKGERHVESEERKKLHGGGRSDLASRVRLVSTDPSLGYDVLSFAINGKEIHVEVKTTTRSRVADAGFYLTSYEMSVAAIDSLWRIYRVCEIDVEPSIQDLGNIVMNPVVGWTIEPSTWRISPAQDSHVAG